MFIDFHLGIFILLAFDIIHFGCHSKILTYQMARDAILNAEQIISTGGHMILSPKEKKVDKILLRYKNEEIEKGFNDSSIYAPGLHFFRAKYLIEQSKIFKFIKKMPKGGLLHGHNSAMVSSEWIIKNLTYYPDMMKCINKNGNVILTFKQSFNNEYRPCVKVSDERNQSNNAELYDNDLEKLINLYTTNPETEYLHITTVWKKFEDMFAAIGEVISYLPVFREFHWRLLEEMFNDGVIYIELRTSLARGYDNSGKLYSEIDLALELKKIIEKFKITHPSFSGAKVIYSVSRKMNIESFQKKVKVFKNIHNQLPNFIVGFDFVGQEDLGKTLYEFLDAIKTLPEGSKFFFHAGETNWYGVSTDENVIDALLLNATRIGHGFSIIKHPVLWNSIKRKGIAIEINPISNQVLHLLLDLRNHPAAFYVSENIPIVISNDDPGFWNAKGLSYDFYYAFMCFTSARSGLSSLKNFVWNSLKYSMLTKYELKEATISLQNMWNLFLDDIINTESNLNID